MYDTANTASGFFASRLLSQLPNLRLYEVQRFSGKKEKKNEIISYRLLS